MDCEGLCLWGWFLELGGREGGTYARDMVACFKVNG